MANETPAHYVAHTIAGRLYVVSKIEAENEEDALQRVKDDVDENPIGERFVMDDRDPMDEYEIVDARFLTEPPIGVGPLMAFDLHDLTTEIRRRGFAVCVFQPSDAEDVIRDDVDAVEFLARNRRHLEDRMSEVGNEALQTYAEMDGIAAKPHLPNWTPDAGSISATVHSDDYFIDFEFNAAPWFSQASNDEIVALAKIDWGGDYEADAVAQFFAESSTKKLFDYLAIGSSVGFECHINADETMRWLRENRPEVAKAIDLLP